MDQVRQALLVEFARGAELIFDNAAQLYTEACTLRSHGALGRAYCLHQLSNEECGKLELLGGFAITVCCGYDYDLKKMAKALRDHERKNHANAYDADTTKEELEARARGDFAGSSRAFKELKKKVHETFNKNKNASLYVNFEAGVFSAPKDLFTDELVQEIALLNEFFLRMREPYVRLFRRVAYDEWGFQKSSQRLMDAIKARPAGAPSDTDPVAKLIQELLEEIQASEPQK
jgi:AbiV family abortive infection protein